MHDGIGDGSLFFDVVQQVAAIRASWTRRPLPHGARWHGRNVCWLIGKTPGETTREGWCRLLGLSPAPEQQASGDCAWVCSRAATGCFLPKVLFYHSSRCRILGRGPRRDYAPAASCKKRQLVGMKVPNNYPQLRFRMMEAFLSLALWRGGPLISVNLRSFPWVCFKRWTGKLCFSDRALVKTRSAFKNCVFQASKLVSTKTLLLKHYYRRQG